MPDPIEQLRALHAPVAMTDVEAILGKPQADIGSGIHIYTYALASGATVRVGTPDAQHVMYITVIDGSGKQVIYQQAP